MSSFTIESRNVIEINVYSMHYILWHSERDKYLKWKDTTEGEETKGLGL